MENEVSKIYTFKCVTDDKGKYSHKLEVVVTLGKDRNGKDAFSCSANLLTTRGRFIYGGQIIGELEKLIENNDIERIDEAKEICRLWKAYHLNQLKPGTPEQMNALHEKYGEDIPDYSKQCEYLESIGMLVVELDGEPYQYGTRWLHREIPSEDFEIIKSLVS